MRQNLTLHDGTILPEGCHIQMATYEVGIDPERVENADTFDGYRHYNKRKREGEANWHRKAPFLIPIDLFISPSTAHICF